jgi:hypothetical protein
MVFVVQVGNRLAQRFDAGRRTILSAVDADVDRLGAFKAAFDVVLDLQCVARSALHRYFCENRILNAIPRELPGQGWPISRVPRRIHTHQHARCTRRHRSKLWWRLGPHGEDVFTVNISIETCLWRRRKLPHPSWAARNCLWTLLPASRSPMVSQSPPQFPMSIASSGIWHCYIMENLGRRRG